MRVACLFLFLWSGLSFAHPWSSYTGCYETVSINGARVTTPANVEPTSIQELSSLRYYLGMDRAPVSGIDFKIFTRKSGSAYYHYHALFFEAGVLNGNTYTFEGEVRLRPIPDESVVIKKDLTLRPQGAGRVELRVRDYSNSDEVNLVYVLKKRPC